MTNSRFSKWLQFTGLLGVIVCGLVVQFIWQMFLGSEIPSNITIGEFITYSLASTTVCIGVLWYIRSIKSNTMLVIVCLVIIPFLWFWGLSIADTWEYSRIKLLVISRYIGFGTTLTLGLLTLCKIFHNAKTTLCQRGFLKK
jgi:hypothetical protein